MNLRSLFIALSVMAAILAVLIFAGIGVYKYKPEWIGMQNPSDTTKKKVELPPPAPVFIKPVKEERLSLITQSQLAAYEKIVLDRNGLSKQKDSLNGIINFMKDSLKRVNVGVNNYKDSLKRNEYNISIERKSRQTLNDSLAKVSAELKKNLDRGKIAQKKLEDYEKAMGNKIDTLEKKNFATFAKMYENMKADQVALLLEQLDERDAAKILKLISVKKAGKILELMKPENAAAILLLGAGQ